MLSSLAYDPLEFDGIRFRVLDAMRADWLAKADDLRRRVASTRALGDVLTRDIIAEGRAVILHDFDVRNDSPYFPPLFLTFFIYPQFIGPTDDALLRLRASVRKSEYREFTRRTQRAPTGGLFELNIYSALDVAFPDVVAQPTLPGSTKRSDVLISIDGTSVYVEATALAEAASTTKRNREMQAQGKKVWTYVESVDDGGGRIVRKIAEELSQIAENAANVVCLSFFDDDPLPPVREWAIADIWQGAPKYGGLLTRDGVPHDLSRINRVDSIFEFGRKRLLNVHVNPAAVDPYRLSDATRERLRAAFDGDLYIR